jgi:hypothetical protein
VLRGKSEPLGGARRRRRHLLPVPSPLSPLLPNKNVTRAWASAAARDARNHAPVTIADLGVNVRIERIMEPCPVVEVAGNIVSSVPVRD